MAASEQDPSLTSPGSTADSNEGFFGNDDIVQVLDRSHFIGEENAHNHEYQRGFSKGGIVGIIGATMISAVAASFVASNAQQVETLHTHQLLSSQRERLTREREDILRNGTIDPAEQARRIQFYNERAVEFNEANNALPSYLVERYGRQPLPPLKVLDAK